MAKERFSTSWDERDDGVWLLFQGELDPAKAARVQETAKQVGMPETAVLAFLLKTITSRQMLENIRPALARFWAEHQAEVEEAGEG